MAKKHRSDGTPVKPAPPLVEQINNGRWLDPTEAVDLLNELYYQRAIHAYMMILPVLNTIGMRDGSEAMFGGGYNVLPIWKDRMDSRCWVPTPNADVIYSMGYLDLKGSGPLGTGKPRLVSSGLDVLPRPSDDRRDCVIRLSAKVLSGVGGIIPNP